MTATAPAADAAPVGAPDATANKPDAAPAGGEAPEEQLEPWLAPVVNTLGR